MDEQEYINDYITYMEDSELLEKSWERWEINASTALQEGHEYGSDEFYSRIAELEEMDRLAEQYEPSESDDEPPESDMSLDDEALEIAVAESDDWEKEANSGALDERVETNNAT